MYLIYVKILKLSRILTKFIFINYQLARLQPGIFEVCASCLKINLLVFVYLFVLHIRPEYTHLLTLYVLELILGSKVK